MAFVDTNLATKDDLPPMPVQSSGNEWYNVHNTVGPQRFVTYRKDDVLLVQLFIHWVAKNPAWKYPDYPEPTDKLEVDGVFGKTTKKWIEWYQSSRGLTRDGKVSRATSGTTASKKFFMIVLLNQEFAGKDPLWHEKLAKDERTPPELREALERPNRSGPRGDTLGRW